MATDLNAGPSDVAVFLGLFLTPVMLLRFPWHKHEPMTRSVQRYRSKEEWPTMVRKAPREERPSKAEKSVSYPYGAGD